MYLIRPCQCPYSNFYTGTSIFCLRRPISGTRRRANCSCQSTDSVIISLVGSTSGQQGWNNFNKVGPTVGRRSIRTWAGGLKKSRFYENLKSIFSMYKTNIFSYDENVKNCETNKGIYYCICDVIMQNFLFWSRQSNDDENVKMIFSLMGPRRKTFL